MTGVRRWVGGLAAAGVAIAIFAAVVAVMDPAEPPPRAVPASARPSRPPGPNDPKPGGIPHPAMPVLSEAWKAQLAEQVRGQERPGEAAFRAVSDRYVDENRELAARQAAEEGLTMAELRELTYFGLMVLATQRTSDVEEVIGRALTAEERDELAELMQSSNGEFRDSMRALVARGGGETERWALIRTTEARYQAELFRITGLDAGTLDDLLAGNLALPGAPIRGEAPSGPPAGGPRDQVGTPPRPER
jgi:hypothetical protein